MQKKKAYDKKYYAKPEVITKRMAYKRTDEVKVRNKAYEQRPEVKEKRRNYYKINKRT